jgi:hypothetical protein
MNAWAVLDAVTLDVVFNYVSEASQKNGYSGYLNMCHHIEVPEGLAWDLVKGVRAAEDGTVTLQADPQKIEDHKAALWSQIRAERNRRLAATDWTALSDAHLSQDRKDAWFAYRQELRDLPDLVTDPLSVEWPTSPIKDIERVDLVSAPPS